MSTRDRPRRVRAAALATFAIVVGAWGASSEPESERPAGVGAATAPVVRLPDVIVRDVAAAIDVPLTGLLPADRPLLLWFWAPH